MSKKNITISVEELKCLQELLKPLSQLLTKLNSGAEIISAPAIIKKKETKSQALDRMLKSIDQREAKKLIAKC